MGQQMQQSWSPTTSQVQLQAPSVPPLPMHQLYQQGQQLQSPWQQLQPQMQQVAIQQSPIQQSPVQPPLHQPQSPPQHSPLQQHFGELQMPSELQVDPIDLKSNHLDPAEREDASKKDAAA